MCCASPVSIQVSVQQDPLRVVVRDVGQLTHVEGEQAILPLAGGHVDVAIQFLGADGLGVQVPNDNLQASAVVGPKACRCSYWWRRCCCCRECAGTAGGVQGEPTATWALLLQSLEAGGPCCPPALQHCLGVGSPIQLAAWCARKPEFSSGASTATAWCAACGVFQCAPRSGCRRAPTFFRLLTSR